jgi:hypothetical protein
MDKSVEREAHSKVLRRVAKLLAENGFARTKTTFFVMRRALTIEFVHIHKFSFDHGYRIHLGIRVLNDDFEAEALNGPDSDTYRHPKSSPNGSRYHLRFGWDDASISKCAAEIFRWCVDIGEPWFQRFRDPLTLINDGESPLRAEEKITFQLALDGRSDPLTVRKSEELLGIGPD